MCLVHLELKNDIRCSHCILKKDEVDKVEPSLTTCVRPSCFVSCTWSLTSEAIATQRRWRPAGGKESAPAPSLWPGETHTVRARPIPARVGAIRPLSLFSLCRPQLRIQKPQSDVAACCLLDHVLWTCVTW